MKVYYGHILAWIYTYGEIPTFDIDHIDGNPSNNRIDNLRLSTKGENARHSKRPVNNTSGYKGVSWNKRLNKWVANISVDRKGIYLGSFKYGHDAYFAYCVAAIKYHGDFAKFD